MVGSDDRDLRGEVAARQDAGPDGAAILEEDVYAKQERLFTEGTSEMPS
ncbi:hypothetical protein [Anaeroselena agilis]|uniref:Uncharacterized protein n=1 Tax=Anaeroselena agilis TaxID=3063788 RepID=A0ABU3P065_9FIRM|nr:hypothetical protein [Selenomonadales bacterium 4137-cl]